MYPATCTGFTCARSCTPRSAQNSENLQAALYLVGSRQQSRIGSEPVAPFQ